MFQRVILQMWPIRLLSSSFQIMTRTFCCKYDCTYNQVTCFSKNHQQSSHEQVLIWVSPYKLAKINVQLSWLQLPCFQSSLFISVFNKRCEKCYEFQVLIIHTWWYICIITVLSTLHVCQRLLYLPFIPTQNWNSKKLEVVLVSTCFLGRVWVSY